MIVLRKPQMQSLTLIRAATGYELSNYEKHKLSNIEENAQENKIEIITLNGQRLPIDKKEVQIELGNLAFKSSVTSDDVSTDELFFIKCELDETN